MFETLDKIFLAGLGAMSMTRERAEKIFDEYVSRGETEKGNRAGFVKDVMDTAEKTRKELEQLVSNQVNKAVSQLNLATHDDIKELEKKIDKLFKKEK